MKAVIKAMKWKRRKDVIVSALWSLFWMIAIVLFFGSLGLIAIEQLPPTKYEKEIQRGSE